MKDCNLVLTLVRKVSDEGVAAEEAEEEEEVEAPPAPIAPAIIVPDSVRAYSNFINSMS
jgi:hypothetical protein